MSADKYPCIFSRQMETIVYLLPKYLHANAAVIFNQGGGGGGGSDEVWDRETMFAQLAKRSIRGRVSGLLRRRCVFS